ncbi:hypothetical protein FS749_008837 [Ceratobasidium sp. UAMH 11750]|nr:hypothetical protein FS749_008837 [Ceratobasidium sp. UAMH 11750]
MAFTLVEVKDYLPVRKNTFTESEKIWLEENWMNEFRQIDGRRRAEHSRGDESDSAKNSAEAFRKRLVTAFAERFPWRLPENKDNPVYPEEVRMMACWGDADWAKAGEVCVVK